jgi:hypothetical protein
MTLMTLERWSQPLPKDGAKQGESTRRKIFPLAKLRGNRKDHVVDRKIAWLAGMVTRGDRKR